MLMKYNRILKMFTKIMGIYECSLPWWCFFWSCVRDFFIRKFVVLLNWQNKVLCSIAKSLLQYLKSMKATEVIHINKMHEMPWLLAPLMDSILVEDRRITVCEKVCGQTMKWLDKNWLLWIKNRYFSFKKRKNKPISSLIVSIYISQKHNKWSSASIY